METQSGFCSFTKTWQRKPEVAQKKREVTDSGRYHLVELH